MANPIEPGPVRLADVLDRATRALGTPSARSVEIIFDRWADVVGATMAARTRPTRIDGATLVVTCDEPAVATHLRYLETQLLERISELSKERRVNRIDLHVSRGTRGARDPRESRRPSRSSGRGDPLESTDSG